MNFLGTKKNGRGYYMGMKKSNSVYTMGHKAPHFKSTIPTSVKSFDDIHENNSNSKNSAYEPTGLHKKKDKTHKSHLEK